MAEETQTWLNPDFLENILRKAKNDDSIRVVDIFSKAATAKGDNYTSDMHRISVKISWKQGDREFTKKKSLIVKVAPTGDNLKSDMIEKSGIFITEMSMMTGLLKKMNDLVGPDHILGGRVFYVKKESPMFLVIEDLAPLGFRMADRQAGLDLTHCMLAMRGLARFHASSVAVCEKEPHHTKIYTKGIYYSGHPPELTCFFNFGTKSLAAQVKKWPNYEKYAVKIDKIADKLYYETAKLMKYRDGEFNVINHGDFWVNNMMFRYNEEGKPIDHIFVDFQMCVYGSPAIDLQYFLSTSPNKEVYENNRNELIEEYHSTLCNIMKQLHCKTQPPSMEKFLKSMKEYEIVAMISSFAILPLVLVDRTEAKDLNEIMTTEGHFDNPAYETELYRKVISRRLPYYDELGLLDF
ncbi:hypothetical protein M0802_001577 [Mischocyttarus mexicanus]|nr:hypothetical protein M0802_001577 [Mischocyttarus mexicanus]